MTKEKIVQQGAFGFIINFDTTANMETTSSLKFRLKKNDGTVVEHAINISNIIGDKTLGVVNYLVEEGDFDVLGRAKFQIIDDSAGRYLPSTPQSIKVVPNV